MVLMIKRKMLLKNAQKCDAPAMAIIQQAVHDQLFSRVAAASTTKEAWEILKMEFEGDSKVKVVKLQGLRSDFENLSMKEGEPIGEYFGRVMALVSQKRAFGETIGDQTVVEKILRNLTPKFDYVVPSIEVAYDLSTLTPVKLMGCLQSQEERINSRTPEKKNGSDEHSIQAMHDSRGNGSRGRGRLSFRGRGRERSSQDKSKIPHCTHCNKYGHFKKDCWYNDEQSAIIAKEKDENEEDEERLFMAITDDKFVLVNETKKRSNNNTLWFLDSGASNHMTGCKESFTELDESFQMIVQL
ncbi:uncharacterized protein LOC143579154 [Bidens hawaiensis]|uniref:uncharacterized protein LOC143579154 n=1 Tax=Bidens hawaiensis TaxID=980011 RepID=UPI0040494676